MTPAATVALRMLDALGVTTVEEAREVLILWCRPSPRLSVLDVRQILAQIEQDNDRDDGQVYERDHEPTGAPLPNGVRGFAITGRNV